MKIFRWWGIAAFFFLILIFAVIWYFVAPIMIKNTIQELGSEALGSKVELDSVELKLFPVSVKLNHLVATDPNQSMKNIFDSKTVEFAVDTESLLWKKIVIDELVIDGVKTNTDRNVSGELVGGRKTTQVTNKISNIEIPELTKDDVNRFVDKADLITVKRIKELNDSQNRIKSEWDKDLDKAAFEARTKKIENEYKRLSKRLKENKLSLLTDRKAWKQLKRDIDVERKNIKRLSKKIKTDKNLLNEQFKSVKLGPKDDLNAVMQKFGIGNGVEGLIEHYIGPQYTPWITRILSMIEPMSKAKEEETRAIQVGDKVYFTDKHIFPEMLIKKLKLNGGDNSWVIDGNGFDLGYLPWLTGNPAKVDIKLTGDRLANFLMTSNWSSQSKMKTVIQSQIKKWPVSNMTLMESPEGSWIINQGILAANINGNVSLESIDLKMKLTINQPSFAIPQGVASWQQDFAKSLNQQKNIDIQVIASGSIAEPSIKVKSNLEKVLKSAIGQKVSQKAEALKDDVKLKISEKVGDISALEKFNENFKGWEDQLGSKDNLLESLLGKIKL